MTASAPSFPTQCPALVYDPTTRSCDIVIEDGDEVMDTTPATAMLLSLGLDRRAQPDDVLPSGVTPFTTPVTWSPRRGWAGDCLDRFGNLVGSRMWLLDREKTTDDVLLRAQTYLTEAFAWFQAQLGLLPTISVSWRNLDTKSPALLCEVYINGHTFTFLRAMA